MKEPGNGLSRLEWRCGGEFVVSNRAVDRHNRDISTAYEMGVASCRVLTGCPRCGVGIDDGDGNCAFCVSVTEEQVIALRSQP
jgi:hypothetical protein